MYKVADLSIYKKICNFFIKKRTKMFGGSEKSRTFASAFASQQGAKIKESSLKDLHRQRSSTRSEY